MPTTPMQNALDDLALEGPAAAAEIARFYGVDPDRLLAAYQACLNADARRDQDLRAAARRSSLHAKEDAETALLLRAFLVRARQMARG